MCGICVIVSEHKINRKEATACLDSLEPRGPDVATEDVLVHGGREVFIGFSRLHIQGSKSGAEQPFHLKSGGRVVCNGEIFNSDILIEQLGLEIPEGASDCAVIPALLDRGMPLAEVARQLDGDFAIVVVHEDHVEVARDPYGVRPLFYGAGSGTISSGGWRALVSELKGFPAGLDAVETIDPGSVRVIPYNVAEEQTIISWHEVPWLKVPVWRSSLEGLSQGGQALRQSLEEAVAKRMSTVRAIGACLSGGLDSSLVAALAAKILAKRGQRLHTYSIGMEGSPDLAHARLVATHIGSIHHERIVTAAECLAVIPAVIKAIETFDITTVRASVGNYLVAKLVTTETPDVKVVLNGDGADEALGGYLYMRAAPDDAAFEFETDRLLREIHLYDVCRSERTMAAHGLESRSPFLDRQFIAVARALPTDVLRPTASTIEKSILRTAFSESGLIPKAVLWRRKEAFSDGISRAENSWFEMAKAEGERRASMSSATYEVNPPKTGEARWYRELFHEQYPIVAAAAVAPAMWMPRFVKGAIDPSARTLNLYRS
jgi:asparagine synthase (glutamine-hydrolysing)